MSFLQGSNGNERMRGLERQLTEQGAILTRLASRLEIDDSADENRQGRFTPGMSTVTSMTFSPRNNSLKFAEAGTEEADTVDALSFGDFLVLKDVTIAAIGGTDGNPDASSLNIPPTDGYVCGDGGMMRLGMQSCNEQNKRRDPLNFDDFVFKCIPALNYRQRNELEIIESDMKKKIAKEAARTQKRGAQKLTKKQRRNILAEEKAEKVVVELLRSRVEAEEAHNNDIMTKLLNGDAELRVPVKYGDMVQLMHMKSGRFLSVCEKAAPYDPECRAANLATGSSAAQFKFMPRFKAQVVGNVVYFNDSLVLESSKQRGMHLHTSGHAYSLLCGENDPLLPKCLQKGRTYEVNVSPGASTLKVLKYGRFSEKERSLYQTGSMFRLYHTQSDSFVSASSDSEKDRRFASAVAGAGLASVRKGGHAAHIPYLKSLPDRGDDPDPSDPTYHSAKAVWAFEPSIAAGGRRYSTTLKWDQGSAVRVRHIPSGRYLCVDTSAPFHEDQGMGTNGEKWYRVCLVDDAALEEDELLQPQSSSNDDLAAVGDAMQSNSVVLDEGFKAVEPHRLEFHVTCADVTDGEYIPNGDVNVRLEHHFHSPEDGSKQVIYLHNSEMRKAPILINLDSSTLSDGEKKVGSSEGSEIVRGDIIARSFSVVFSSVRSAQDIFKLMHLRKEESQDIRLASALRTSLWQYTIALQNRSSSITDYHFEETVSQLLFIIEMQSKGHRGPIRDAGLATSEKCEDWIRLANRMLPAAFAKRFAGEPDVFMQRTCRDVKLLDAIFAAGCAPYARTNPHNPWSAKKAPSAATGAVVGRAALGAFKQAESNDIEVAIQEISVGPRAVQKFVHVALQRLCDGNRESQEYFGRRSEPLRILDRNMNRTLPNPWMSIILQQLEDPLGSAVTLSKLLSSNESLMTKFANPTLIDRFLEMIRELGPQPRLVSFFEAVCTVDGHAVKANQEMILRLTYMPPAPNSTRPNWRNKIYLKTQAADVKDVKLKFRGAGPNSATTPRSYGPVLQPSGAATDGRIPESMIKTAPKDYIGKETFERGFDPVFITWSGSDIWEQGIDSLFFSAKSMGIPEWGGAAQGTPMAREELPDRFNDASGNGSVNEWVRIEDLCWVLDPPRLCKAITGEAWEAFADRMDVDSAQSLTKTNAPEDSSTSNVVSKQSMHQRFNRQKQLAEYYVAQLNLFAKMCFGRSYNCIQWMVPAFPYITLCSIAYNEHLPSVVRSAAVRFTMSLYLDRFPQLTHCGRPSLPEQLWIYEPLKLSGDALAGLPILRPMKLSEEGSLPGFMVSPTNKKLVLDPDPFFSFPTGFKFYLLRNLGNGYLQGYGSGEVVHSAVDENNLAGSIIALIDDLTKFGFQSNHQKLKDLVGHLVRLLDGRNEVATRDLGDSSDVAAGKRKELRSGRRRGSASVAFGTSRAFDPLEKRYKFSAVSPQVTSMKVTVINILEAVTNLRANFRLAKLMSRFRDYVKNDKICKELKRFHAHAAENKDAMYEGPLTDTIFEDFEELFEKGDGALLQLDTISGQPVDTVLVDCLLYDDDRLFAAALKLLEINYTQRRTILQAVNDVTLLQNEQIPIFGDVPTMSAELGYLTFLVRSSEVWGVSSRVSGQFQPEKKTLLSKTCDKIISFLLTDSMIDYNLTDDTSEVSNPLTGPSKVIERMQNLLDVRDSVGATAKAAGEQFAFKNALANRLNFKDFNGNPESKVDDNDDYGEADGDDIWNEELEASILGLNNDDARNSLDVVGSQMPVMYHQNILRAMNLQDILVSALAIDYNISFKGSICSPQDKLKSRDQLVLAQRKFTEVLVMFVRGNPENQGIIFAHLDALRCYIGDLKVPSPWPADFPSDLRGQVATAPGMNTEEVIIECLRSNERLCQSRVPRDLIESFGILMDGVPDPTDTTNLEFFSILCLPHGFHRTSEYTKPITRNQDAVLDVLLSDRLRHFKSCLESLFFTPSGGSLATGLAKPERLVRLLCATICNKNLKAASKLQGKRYTVDATIFAIDELLRGHGITSAGEEMSDGDGKDIGIESTANLSEPISMNSKSGTETSQKEQEAEKAVANDAYLASLVELLALQMEVLVIDPKIYRRPQTWNVLVHALGKILCRAARITRYETKKGTGKKGETASNHLKGGQEEVHDLFNRSNAATVSAACIVAKTIVSGARGLGLTELEAKHRGPLLNNRAKNGSNMLTSVSVIANAVFTQRFPDLRRDASHLKSALNPAKDTLDDISEDEGDEDGDVVYDDDEDEDEDGEDEDEDDVDSDHEQAENLRAQRAASNPKNIAMVREGIEMSSIDGTRRETILEKKVALHRQETVEEMDRRRMTISEAKIKGLNDSALSTYVPPTILRSYFSEALQGNTHLKNKLRARRFEFVTILEDAEKFTGKDALVRQSQSQATEGGNSAGIGASVVGGVIGGIGSGVASAASGVVGGLGASIASTDPRAKGCDVVGSVKITFDMLVDRMLKYLKMHNYDKDESSCIRIMNLFLNHVLKGRSNLDGSERNFGEMKESEQRFFKARQNNLNSKGVTLAVLNAISTHVANVEGNLADEAVEVLKELLFAGNLAVQNEVKYYVSSIDHDNKFLSHMKARMEHSLFAIKERKEKTSTRFVIMDEVARGEFENAEQTFDALSELCEGHNIEMQDVLRYQEYHTTEVNLIALAAHMFVIQCETNACLKRMEEAEFNLVISNLDFLTECVQGPCSGNQELLIMKCDGFVACLDKLLQSPFHSRVSIAVRVKVKAVAIQLLASCVEGRHDLVIHENLAHSIEPKMCDHLRGYLKSVLDKLAKRFKRGKIDMDTYEEIESVAFEALTSLSNLYAELRQIQYFDTKYYLIEKEKSKNELHGDLMDSNVCKVEILWNDRIESVSFTKPKDAAYLTSMTKAQFILNADLSTNEKRMKDLMKEAPLFMDEMAQIYKLSNRSWLYKYIHHNIINIKWSMYALVVLLNINVVMASYGRKGRAKDFGYRSAWEAMTEGLNEDAFFGSLIITWVLGMINLIGYIVIVTFLAVTEVPVIISRQDEDVQEKIDDVTVLESSYRNIGAFTWWGVTLVFNVMFIVMHLSNYPNQRNDGLYGFMILGVNLPWTLSCVRNYIVVPDTPQTRIFCIVYDTLVSKPFFRNHVLLMVFSINGFINNYWFTLMLMDIMNNSKVLGDVSRSVTDNIVALGWVFYLFIVTVVIYAQFGLEFFEDYFLYDGDTDDADERGCHSVVSCIFLIFYHGVPEGSLTEVLDVVDNRRNNDEVNNTYLQRVLFDLSFFIWVGVLLFNIITGLMVDGFGALREEDNIRNNIMENECFVCGFTRTSYDDEPIVRGPSFDVHKDIEHQHWNYVLLYVYLKRRDSTQYTGAESYIWNMIEKMDYSWIPSRGSFAIQSYKARMALEKQKEELKPVDGRLVEHVAEEVSDIKKNIEHVAERIGSGSAP